MVNQRIYSVSQLNNEIKSMLESNPSFNNLFVQGEISNYKAHPSGHHYMTLKDDGAAISAVLFRSDVARLRFRLQNGMKVIARGRVSSFPKSGQVQIYLSDMMPDGVGVLHLQFEQTKKKLMEQGLFDESHKKILPLYPMTVGIITSQSGAALQDMLRILKRRWKAANIILYPSAVQGISAPSELINAVKLANKHDKADVLIIGRGGGSMEDLWAFNDEKLAYEIYKSKIPIISAVGHEPDFTISDFVCDLRAPTPSGGAEIAVPDANKVIMQIKNLEKRLKTAAYIQINTKAHALKNNISKVNAHSPEKMLSHRMKTQLVLQKQLENIIKNEITTQKVHCDMLQTQLKTAMQRQLSRKKQEFALSCTGLDALSPLKVLGRGYSITTNKNGKIIHDAGILSEGENISIRFEKGMAQCVVCSVEEGTDNGNQKKTNI